MGDEFYREPPWLDALPASYAAYYREPSPDGRPRWKDTGVNEFQCALLAALLIEVRGAAGGFDPNG